MATADGFQTDMQLISTDGDQIITRIFFFAKVGGVESARNPAISYRSLGIICIGSTSPSLYIVFAKFVSSYQYTYRSSVLRTKILERNWN